MKTKTRSLRTGLAATILLCWLAPMLTVIGLSSLLLERSYRAQVQQEVQSNVASALRLLELQLKMALADSNDISYEGVIRQAYQNYLANGASAELYRSTSDYLRQRFFRRDQYKAVSIHYWDKAAGVNSYYLSSGAAGYELLDSCRQNTPVILNAMQNADTGVYFMVLDGELVMARNLFNTRFVPYATAAMLMDTSRFFGSLAGLDRVEAMVLELDGVAFALTEQGLQPAPAGYTGWDLAYTSGKDGHTLRFWAATRPYDLWRETPWLPWMAVGMAGLALPLLAVMVALFYRHIGRPIELLAAANGRVRQGQRGYAIAEAPPNREFGLLYSQFNAMSQELERQFERAYLEQQATQRAQIKALQSQINPHFLNNTLEIINWEARLAGCSQVSAMIEALSTMLRAALDRNGRAMVRLAEELGYLDAYLYIIGQRMGGALQVHRQIAPGMQEQLVPRLILQPIVENAIEHDIVARRGGSVTLRAALQQGQVVLEVEHDGQLTGQDQANIRRMMACGEAARGQVGLKNVYQRLKLQYGEAGSLTITQQRPGVVLARVQFPASP